MGGYANLVYSRSTRCGVIKGVRAGTILDEERSTQVLRGKEPKLLKRGLNLVSLGKEEGDVIKGEVEAQVM